jgi:hypothetical protein
LVGEDPDRLLVVDDHATADPCDALVELGGRQESQLGALQLVDEH